MPTDPKFVVKRDGDYYTVLIRTENGAYTPLLSLGREYQWLPAAEIIIDALTAVDPVILPNPSPKDK